MPDLDELGEALLPGAQRVGKSGGGPISWVRVMTTRVPAFDALEPGDLAIVPAAALAVVAPGRDELRAFVDACVAARLSGLLLVGGDESAGQADVSEGAPVPSAERLDELAAALADTPLPALRVPRADLGALERSVIG